MKREDNLIPVDTLPEEKRKKICSKGGKASSKARKEKADLKKALDTVLSMDCTDKIKEKMEKLGFGKEGNTNANALAATLFAMAMKGDKKAMEMILQYSFQFDENDRKSRESNARVRAIEKNIGDMSVDSGDDDDGGVTIYLPKVDDLEDEEATEEVSDNG